MRTEDGEEIVEPGYYDLGEGQTLRVYLTQDDDEQIHMWACTHCQEVDGVLNGILTLVLDGQMTLRQDDEGQFFMSMTEAGTDRVKNMIRDLADSTDDGDES